MDHHVIIRWNRGRPDNEWFDYRLELFRSITLPSLAGQTCDMENVDVVLMIDPDTAGGRLEELIRIAADMLPRVRLSEFGPAESIDPYGRYITTRIDSDDAIAPDFLERIHTDPDVLKCDYSFFPCGVFWDVHRRRCALMGSQSPNQFLSRYTTTRHGPGSSPTVYDVKHGDASPVYTIHTNEPMWVWTLHHGGDMQMSNTTSAMGITKHIHRRRGWVPDGKILERFNIKRPA